MNDKVDFIEAARGYVMEALEVLAEIIRDTRATAPTRLRAIALLFDKAIGRQAANAAPRSADIPRSSRGEVRPQAEWTRPPTASSPLPGVPQGTGAPPRLAPEIIRST